MYLGSCEVLVLKECLQPEFYPEIQVWSNYAETPEPLIFSSSLQRCWIFWRKRLTANTTPERDCSSQVESYAQTRCFFAGSKYRTYLSSIICTDLQTSVEFRKIHPDDIGALKLKPEESKIRRVRKMKNAKRIHGTPQYILWSANARYSLAVFIRSSKAPTVCTYAGHGSGEQIFTFICTKRSRWWCSKGNEVQN